MSNTAQTPRQELYEKGYTIVRNVFTKEEAARGAEILLSKITPETPGSFAHNEWGTRRQLRIPQNYIPEMDEYACNENLLAVVGELIEGPFKLGMEPIPCVTFTGKVAGSIHDGNWAGHVDGFPPCTQAEREGTFASGWIAFLDIEPRGGGMTILPGSHHWVEKAIQDPEFRKQKEERNSYGQHENLPGLEWNPVEITCKAGDVFFNNGDAIHNASDNQLETPRTVCMCSYSSTTFGTKEEDAPLEERFNSEHLEIADERFKKLIEGDEWSDLRF
jgi:hypothetical protein